MVTARLARAAGSGLLVAATLGGATLLGSGPAAAATTDWSCVMAAEPEATAEIDSFLNTLFGPDAPDYVVGIGCEAVLGDADTPEVVFTLPGVMVYCAAAIPLPQIGHEAVMGIGC